MSTQVFCLFFNWVFWFFDVAMSFLYILYINHLFIFPFCWWLPLLYKIFKFNWVPFVYFCFYFFCFRRQIQKYCYNLWIIFAVCIYMLQCWMIFIYYFYIHLMNWPICQHIGTFFVSCDKFTESLFYVLYVMSPLLSLGYHLMEYHFSSLHLQFVYALNKINLLYEAYCWFLLSFLIYSVTLCLLIGNVIVHWSELTISISLIISDCFVVLFLPFLLFAFVISWLL